MKTVKLTRLKPMQDELLKLRQYNKAMLDLLKWLNDRGGLGFEKHKLISEVIAKVELQNQTHEQL